VKPRERTRDGSAAGHDTASLLTFVLMQEQLAFLRIIPTVVTFLKTTNDPTAVIFSASFFFNDFIFHCVNPNVLSYKKLKRLFNFLPLNYKRFRLVVGSKASSAANPTNPNLNNAQVIY
jgi:hypothetical protein